MAASVELDSVVVGEGTWFDEHPLRFLSGCAGAWWCRRCLPERLRARAAAAPVLDVSTCGTRSRHARQNGGIPVNVMNVGDEAFTGNLTIRYTFPVGVAVVEPVPDASPGGRVCRRGR